MKPKDKEVTDQPPGSESPEKIKRRIIDNGHTFQPDTNQHLQTRDLLAAAAPSRRA